jgi:predicted NBD/HSP70 family sugar kinase
MPTCIVADLGGTFLRCALVGDNDALTVAERIRLPGNAISRTAAVWDDIVDAIAAYARRRASDLPAGAPIAFAFPGPIVDGVPTGAPTVLGGLVDTPDVGARLAEAARRPVVMINDVSAAAWYFRERIAAERFVVVTVSSGIGAKIFDRRHPLGVIDDLPYAGEIGHLVVDGGESAPTCDCGGRGHLGSIASARGFERSARAAALADPAGFARSAAVVRFGAAAETLCNERHLVPALRLDDPWCTTLLRASTEPLTNVIRTLCVGGGLGGIVLMGGFAQALGERYRQLVVDGVGRFSDCGPSRAVMHLPVVLAGRGEEPSLVGAATFARHLRAAA